MMKVRTWIKSLTEPPKPQPGEIAPGVPRPSYALAGLVAGKILANPLLFKPAKITFPSPEERESGPRWEQTVREWSDGRLKAVKIAKKFYAPSGYYTERWEFFFDGKLYRFDPGEDLALIEKAWQQSLKTLNELKANEARAKKEQEACDIIQSFFTTPPEPAVSDESSLSSQPKEA